MGYETESTRCKGRKRLQNSEKDGDDKGMEERWRSMKKGMEEGEEGLEMGKGRRTGGIEVGMEMDGGGNGEGMGEDGGGRRRLYQGTGAVRRSRP